MSAEEITISGGGRGGGSPYTNTRTAFVLTQPGKKMVGRAFTVQFMPARADVDAVVAATPRRRAWHC